MPLIITMENVRTFIVSGSEAPARLDVFVSGSINEVSRSQVKKLLEEGRVLVNNRPGKPGLKLKDGDSVTVALPEKAEEGLKAEAIPLNILYEDDDVIVLDKPAGLAVHPGAGRPSGTLVNALLYHTSSLSSAGGPLRPGIVHRLDRDTTGVMAVAKNDSSHAGLARQFREHSTERAYTALVWGSVKDSSGVIDMPIGRDSTHRKKISPRSKKHRSAVTRYRVLRRYPYLTLLELKPETGRTHQLRVHLAAINHPVAGDQVYGRKRLPEALPKRALDALKKTKRQCLHAGRLGFIHPARGTFMVFTSPVPADMAEVIDALEETGS